MEAAGLTHGGFYKQFADKEALVVEATEQALAENLGNWGEAIAKAPGDPLGTLRQWYLSKEHIDRVGDGCAYAALAAEAPRHGARSEEHTSELQSLMRISSAVFCLKKKKNHRSEQSYNIQHRTLNQHKPIRLSRTKRC